jgi:hypothetical protein
MSEQTLEQRLVIAECDIAELDKSLSKLQSIKTSSKDHSQTAAMDARLDDYLELAEQSFIKGWIDCEQGIACGRYKTDAYYNGFSECYQWENKSTGYGEDMG